MSAKTRSPCGQAHNELAMRTRIASCPADARNRANGDMGASPDGAFALEARAAARACVVDGDVADNGEEG
jgi:hypothetical protein